MDSESIGSNPLALHIPDSINSPKFPIYDISAQQRNINRAGQNRHRSESAQVRISAGQNQRRPKSAQAKFGTEKNELILLYSALIKKNSYAKFKVLRLMITRYIRNMIAVLRCHYAYLSITITSKLALNHNKMLYYCNCHANDLQQRPHVRSFFS